VSAVLSEALARPPSRWARRTVIAAIRVYQIAISPLLAPACRFEPCCSAYAAEAIARRGVIRGGWLALARIGRCHPWGGFGYDPVP
jgi:putative membrane protein insertion efficiency factor